MVKNDNPSGVKPKARIFNYPSEEGLPFKHPVPTPGWTHQFVQRRAVCELQFVHVFADEAADIVTFGRSSKRSHDSQLIGMYGNGLKS